MRRRTEHTGGTSSSRTYTQRRAQLFAASARTDRLSFRPAGGGIHVHSLTALPPSPASPPLFPLAPTPTGRTSMTSRFICLSTLIGTGLLLNACGVDGDSTGEFDSTATGSGATTSGGGSSGGGSGPVVS